METLKPPPYQTATAHVSNAPAEEHLEANLQAYWHTLTKRKFVLASSLLLCVMAALFINTTQTPIYQSTAELVVGSLLLHLEQVVERVLASAMT